MNAVEKPQDPYDEDDAVHVDELPPFNGDATAAFAFDDEGTRYKVDSGERYPSTTLIPEERWYENRMPERDGVGKTCASCGNTIAWNAMIFRDCDDDEYYHLGCYINDEEGTDT